jgi:hypothetical protein
MKAKRNKTLKYHLAMYEETHNIVESRNCGCRLLSKQLADKMIGKDDLISVHAGGHSIGLQHCSLRLTRQKQNL